MGEIDPVTGCQLWLGTLGSGDPDGSNKYGYFALDNKDWRAHRLSYTLFKGPIPEGYVVDHICRETRCVNPAHLEAVTPQENSRRGVYAQIAAARKRAGLPKYRRQMRKLTAEQVMQIRKLRDETGMAYGPLALKFGVNDQTVADVCNRKTWKHVSDHTEAIG
jgi:hypothetical protein